MNPALPSLFSTPGTHPLPSGPNPSAPGGGNGPESAFQRQYEEAGAAHPEASAARAPRVDVPPQGGALEARNVFQLQDGRLLSPVTGSARSARAPQLFAAEGEALRSLPGRWEGFREKVHARLATGGEISNEELMLMQLELNEISFQVETASKVVEHATAGTKTVLQTQA